ncbi:MAG: primosomal protein N' [Dehalococcoidales bacterium]|nr:primosomal protein N' [Dehalococcoidales bacterium]
MGYAEVCVNAPTAQMRTFSYSIPPQYQIQPGQAVWVPFGQRLLQGIVFELTATPAVEQTRDIAGIIADNPLLSPAQLALARWLSDYYLSPLFNAVALMLPPAFERRVRTYLEPENTDRDLSSLNETQQQILHLLSEQKRIGLKELEKELGKRKTQTAVGFLVNLGLVKRTYELEKVKVKSKTVVVLRLAVPPEEVPDILQRQISPRAVKQRRLLAFLTEQAVSVPLTSAREKTGCDALTVNTLIKKGLISKETVEVRREPPELRPAKTSQPFLLTPAQQAVFEPISREIKESIEKPGKGKVFLLHGVTGSGKTEIYLRALAEAIQRHKKGIVLVPEISMTPQIIERFVARFPGRVALLHSKLTPGEQYDEWHRIKNGEVDVVIGPRSALFAPLADTGVIIMDEEHEWTYKQTEQSPRYHTRDVAVKMSELTGCTVVLGSATPDVSTYYRTQTGEYQLLTLPERVTPVANSPLPEVTVIDMKQELKENNRSIFSRALADGITSALAQNRQVILFLNRRGMNSYVQCRNCGFTIKCRRCETAMTYHLDTASLLCHRCNYKMPVPVVCPRCASHRIRFLGIGTEKLEQEIKTAFQSARVVRWDSDTTKGRHEHQRILEQFRKHKADILIGTQMVAKGLDLPLVTLVGVINADLGLYLPDFRAGERTFQLLSQVAGRAGRGASGGQAIIQTYNPEHYAIQAAAKHDYNLFYEQEIAFRKQLREPPFTQLVNLTFVHPNEQRCEDETRKIAQQILEERDAQGIAGMELIGPAPAYMSRVRGRYRWQIILRGYDLPPFLKKCNFGQGWAIDVDPIGI